ncbi:MAG: T4 RnlA family RNA ligase, partial [Prevotella sp.]|nr:T4 RnlA family RNA ligase [Prevotella sp.]
NISSFNFTKAAFYDKVWDEQTTKARGLYINIPEQKVVARAYDKFFNINERPETKLDMLQYKLAFPVTAYVKENGFLGIASYNDEDDSLFVTTKSSPDGDFAVWLRGNMETQLSAETLEKLKQFSKEHNVSFVFECVDMVHDPHIIEYPESRLYLLDIVYNEMPFRKFGFNEMCAVADELGLRHKEHAFVIETWQEFYDWYYNVTSEGYKYDGRNIEGFVLEDSNGYMVKLKLNYYNFWKFMRSVAHETLRKGYLDPRRTAALTTALANQFYGWVKSLYDPDDKEKNDAIPKDICTLRKMFFETDVGKQFSLE